jgi:hypothetical protein
MGLGSGKNPSRTRIPDPGVKKAPDPGSGTLLGGEGGVGEESTIRPQESLVLYKSQRWQVGAKLCHGGRGVAGGEGAKTTEIKIY